MESRPESPLAAPALVPAIWRDFKRSLPQFVAYEVLFKIVGVALFAPLSAWLLAALISTTGNLAISNEAILAFLLSPTGIVALVVMGTVAVAIAMAEQAGLLVIAVGARRGDPPRTVAVLGHLLRRAPRLLQLAFLQVAAYLGCLLPVAAVAGLTYLVMLSEHNINYYLAEKPPELMISITVAAWLGVMLLLAWGFLYVRWLFALPGCVLSDERPLASLRGSFRQTRGVFWRLTRLLLLWLVATTVLGLAAAVGLKLADRLVLGLVGESLATVVPTIALLMIVNVVSAAALTLAGATSHALLLARLYAEALGQATDPTPMAAVAVPAASSAWLSRKRVVFGGAILLLLVTTVLSHVIVETLDIEDRVAVTAHRGSSLAAPENSLSAVRIAIEQGADYAEIDVQETADGIVVVLHDDDLKRITRAAKAPSDKKIWEIDYDELSRLDAGSWFSPEFEGERIPTLDEVIELAKGRIKLNIELKYNGHDRKLAERTVQIVKRHGFQTQCVLSSLTYDGLIEAKRFDPNLKVGYIAARSLGDLTALEVDFFSLNTGMATAGLIARAHAAGREVHVWTVNDPEQMSSLVDVGVDNIISDDPPAMIAKLQQRAALNNTEKVLLVFRNWLSR